MKILHTEASPGWGGQELRILREAEGMRARGHEIILAVQKGGGLVEPARKENFLVYEIDFKKSNILKIFFQLIRLVKKYKIEIINTHSSLDAWVGGCVAKLYGCLCLRTRHISTSIKKGLNSKILYNMLADYVITTCEEACQNIRHQALLPPERCLSIPTGVNPLCVQSDSLAVSNFRESWGIQPEDCLVGTLCILRSWKGVADLLLAAKQLENVPNLKWLIVGGGISEGYFKNLWKSLQLENKVFFTGYLDVPFTALDAMDIFLLLSVGNEGVSQASLQAALLKKPLITTGIGGLLEVCIPQKTGLQVPKNDPGAVAEAVMKLANNAPLRSCMGKNAKTLVESKFTMEHTLNALEKLYFNAFKKKDKSLM